MTNPMFNPQPNYSGVTIQIANPAVYAGQNSPFPCVSGCCCGVNNQGYVSYPQVDYGPNQSVQKPLEGVTVNPNSQSQNFVKDQVTKSINGTGYPNAYPAQYYLNNYNYGINGEGNNLNEQSGRTGLNETVNSIDEENTKTENVESFKEEQTSKNEERNNTTPNSYKIYADKKEHEYNDMTKSQNIIGDLAEREAELQEEKKNAKETKIVALTDEYIKSLENYLNNPNDEIRLMASKEVLTRLDEDKDRYDDAALNALLNKMLQDPNKLVRIAALSAFSSQLASGNDYTVQLLHNIQSNPNADKEDVLQAADILLKMSAGVEVKNIPNPSVKEKQ